jgi:FkbH-like protein
MLLRRADFAAIEANWQDKPSAVRRIAENLNLGLDAVVFFDDSPFERALMRQTLPDVAVPEVPEAPELYAHLLADAGYFEAASFTADDSQRAAQYMANRSRDSLRSSTTNLDTFLRELRMTLKIEPFRPEDLPRITQLINKTNQFNLTTRRYTDNEVRSLMRDPSALTFSARVSDRFGDNGLTSVVIVRLAPRGVSHTAEIDTWLMSCRVLGRRIEHALFSVVTSEVRAAGTKALVGRYRPTARNAMVKDLYPSLGFQPIDDSGDAGERCWIYSLTDGPPVTADHLEIIHTRESHGSSGYLQGTDGDLTYRI